LSEVAVVGEALAGDFGAECPKQEGATSVGPSVQ